MLLPVAFRDLATHPPEATALPPSLSAAPAPADLAEAGPSAPPPANSAFPAALRSLQHSHPALSDRSFWKEASACGCCLPFLCFHSGHTGPLHPFLGPLPSGSALLAPHPPCQDPSLHPPQESSLSFPSGPPSAASHTVQFTTSFPHLFLLPSCGHFAPSPSSLHASIHPFLLTCVCSLGIRWSVPDIALWVVAPETERPPYCLREDLAH